jgi:hypothetical protein
MGLGLVPRLARLGLRLDCIGFGVKLIGQIENGAGTLP